MRQRHHHDPRQAGFTLVEMMAAIGILTFGLTALLGVLSVGVATRQSAEQNERAVVIAGQARKRAAEHVHEHFAAAQDAGTIPDLVVDQVPGCPGLGYRITFTVQEPERDLALARLHVRWLERGEAAEVVFDHVLPVQELFTERVMQRRNRAGS